MAWLTKAKIINIVIAIRRQTSWLKIGQNSRRSFLLVTNMGFIKTISEKERVPSISRLDQMTLYEMQIKPSWNKDLFGSLRSP